MAKFASHLCSTYTCLCVKKLIIKYSLLKQSAYRSSSKTSYFSEFKLKQITTLS